MSNGTTYGRTANGEAPDLAAPALAVFDFDGTLTRSDSFFPFLKYAVGPVRYYLGLAVLAPVLAAYLVGVLANWKAKERVLRYYLGGLPVERANALGAAFAAERLPALLRPEAVERLRWHLAQRHRVVLVSASPEAYLVPWGAAMGVEAVIGTRLGLHEGRLTGRIEGRNCYGPEKVARLCAAGYDPKACADVYAYGDSPGDHELLAAATHPFYRTFGP